MIARQRMVKDSHGEMEFVNFSEPIEEAMLEEVSKHRNQCSVQQFHQKIITDAQNNAQIANLQQKIAQEYGDINTFISFSQSNSQKINKTPQSFTLLQRQIQKADMALSSNPSPSVLEKYLIAIQKLFSLIFTNKNYLIANNEIVNLLPSQNDPLVKFSFAVINGVLVKLLDLFLNCKVFALKQIIADIFIAHSSVFKTALIKDEILQVLAKAIKGLDEYTRVMACKIVPEYADLLEKDLNVIEHIIHRVQSFDEENGLMGVSVIIEMEHFRSCLRKVLSNSGQLSGIFIKNLQQESQVTFFQDPKDALFVSRMLISNFYETCLSLKLTTTEYAKVFKNLIVIYKRRSLIICQVSAQTNQRIKKLIANVFEVYFEQNFRVLEIFYQQGMEEAIGLNESNIREKFDMFDHYQKAYIRESAPEKMKNLLKQNRTTIQPQITTNRRQTMFAKLHQQLNDFPQQIQAYSINQHLRIKERRLLQFRQLCNYQKHSNIIPLVDIWIGVYSILEVILSNNCGGLIDQKIASLEHEITNFAKVNESFREQIENCAWVFLLIQKAWRNNDNFTLFNSDVWKMNQKLAFCNRHLLKWSYLTPQSIQKLIF